MKNIASVADIPFQPYKQNKLTVEEMLQHLRDLYQKYGGPVTGSMVNNAGIISQQGYVRRFGNLGNALVLAGIPRSKDQHSSSETLIPPYAVSDLPAISAL